SQIVELSPSFPPIEGLPEELWKEQTCSNCHSWTKDALCTQGTTYVTANNQRALSKEHPFGGTFKQGLRVWASEGCN
ncbi:MAG: peptidase C14, caspase catalytic subunit p20, partial [Sulfitobacter sp.]